MRSGRSWPSIAGWRFRTGRSRRGRRCRWRAGCSMRSRSSTSSIVRSFRAHDGPVRRGIREAVCDTRGHAVRELRELGIKRQPTRPHGPHVAQRPRRAAHAGRRGDHGGGGLSDHREPDPAKQPRASVRGRGAPRDSGHLQHRRESIGGGLERPHPRGDARPHARQFVRPRGRSRFLQAARPLARR